MAKDIARRKEKQEDLKDQPQVHHGEGVVRHNEKVRHGEEKSKQKMPHVFATAKKPSPRRRTAGWSSNISIFSPSLAHFPRPINTIIVLMIRVQTLREGGSLLGFSLFKLCSIFRFKFLRFLLVLGLFCEFFGL